MFILVLEHQPDGSLPQLLGMPAWSCHGSNPQRRRTSSGIAKATFRIAVTGRVRDGEQWRDAEPSFFTVVWQEQAEHVGELLAKGSRVVVAGRLVQRSWQAGDGTSRSVVEVVADELGPSLRWAAATTTRATRSPSQ